MRTSWQLPARGLPAAAWGYVNRPISSLQRSAALRRKEWSMKRIAVLTWFNRGRNYGQTLQAFALYCTLKKMGYECELLSYGKNGPRLSDEEINQLSGAKRELQMKFVAFIKQHIQYSIRLRDRESTERYLLENKFDVVLCGSDQIWNPFFSLDTVYFLDFNVPYKKVAYAASMVDIRLASEYEKYPSVPGLLRDFTAISVRENSARTIIRQLIGDDVQATVVLDPTLLLTQDEWCRNVDIAVIQKEKYIFCYMYYITESQKRLIQRLAQLHGCTTVIISDLLKSDMPKIGELHIDPAENVSIEMFLCLIKNAEAVVTDSFHGTAFSIQFEKTFFAVESTQSEKDLLENGKPRSHIDRIGTLLEKAGLPSRLLRYGEEDSAQVKESIGYSDVNKKLAQERLASLEWLRNAIG